MTDSLIITIGFALSGSGALVLLLARLTEGKGLFPLSFAIDREFTAYKHQVEQMIARENNRLRSLGIEPPRRVSEFGYEQKKMKNGDHRYREITFHPPKFLYPEHWKFVIKRDKICATLFKDLEQANADYWWWGLGDAVEITSEGESLYGAVWTNRYPFALYRELEKKPSEKITGNSPGVVKNIAESDKSWGGVFITRLSISRRWKPFWRFRARKPRNSI